MPIPYTPLAIANEFIARFSGEAGIEHMKLQKLVYCSYGWWLGISGMDNVRLCNEGPEIWKHGPVFSSLYKVLRNFGRSPILMPQSSSPFSEPDRVDNEDNHVSDLIVWIWGRYGHLSSFALSDMTHKPGTPWHRVAMENNFTVPMHTKIPDSYIYEEFQKLSQSFGADSSAYDEGGKVEREAVH